MESPHRGNFNDMAALNTARSILKKNVNTYFLVLRKYVYVGGRARFYWETVRCRVPSFDRLGEVEYKREKIVVLE